MKRYEFVELDVDSVEVTDIMEGSSGEWLEIGDYNELSNIAHLANGFYMVKGTKQVVEIEDGILYISYIDGESEFLDYIHNLKNANGITPQAQLLAICKNNEGSYYKFEIGKAYKVVERYVCRYEGNERVVIECEDGSHRDCYAKDFDIKMLAIEAQKGDVISVDDCGKTIIGVVVDRYYEGGIEDNGVQYLTQDNELLCAFDGCYEIIGQVKIVK